MESLGDEDKELLRTAAKERRRKRRDAMNGPLGQEV